MNTAKALELFDAGVRNFEAAQHDRLETRAELETLSATFFWRACDARRSDTARSGGRHQTPADADHSLTPGESEAG